MKAISAGAKCSCSYRHSLLPVEAKKAGRNSPPATTTDDVSSSESKHIPCARKIYSSEMSGTYRRLVNLCFTYNTTHLPHQIVYFHLILQQNSAQIFSRSRIQRHRPSFPVIHDNLARLGRRRRRRLGRGWRRRIAENQVYLVAHRDIGQRFHYVFERGSSNVVTVQRQEQQIPDNVLLMSGRWGHP